MKRTWPEQQQQQQQQQQQHGGSDKKRRLLLGSLGRQMQMKKQIRFEVKMITKLKEKGKQEISGHIILSDASTILRLFRPESLVTIALTTKTGTESNDGGEGNGGGGSIMNRFKGWSILDSDIASGSNPIKSPEEDIFHLLTFTITYKENKYMNQRVLGWFLEFVKEGSDVIVAKTMVLDKMTQKEKLGFIILCDYLGVTLKEI